MPEAGLCTSLFTAVLLRQDLIAPDEGQRPAPHSRYRDIFVNGQVNELGQEIGRPLCLGLRVYTLGRLCRSSVKGAMGLAEAGAPDRY